MGNEQQLSKLSQIVQINGYTYVKALGVGGFADVYQYEQNFPCRQVAVKISHSNYLDLNIRRQFLNEASTLAELGIHPHIINVYDSGLTQSGHLFISMEVASTSLRQLIINPNFSVSQIVSIFLKIGAALEYAHNNGILHCDIKPSNILLSQFNQPLLADFGISSTMGAKVGGTIGRTIAFSPKYCAPEILKGKSLNSVATEVYSLAASLNDCLRNYSSSVSANPLLHQLLKRNLSLNPNARSCSVAKFMHELANSIGISPIDSFVDSSSTSQNNFLTDFQKLPLVIDNDNHCLLGDSFATEHLSSSNKYASQIQITCATHIKSSSSFVRQQQRSVYCKQLSHQVQAKFKKQMNTLLAIGVAIVLSVVGLIAFVS